MGKALLVLSLAAMCGCSEAGVPSPEGRDDPPRYQPATMPATASAGRFTLGPDFLKDMRITIIDDQMIAADSPKELALIEASLRMAVAPPSASLAVTVPIGASDCLAPRSFILNKGSLNFIYSATDWAKCDSAMVILVREPNQVSSSRLEFREGKWESK